MNGSMNASVPGVLSGWKYRRLIAVTPPAPHDDYVLPVVLSTEAMDNLARFRKEV